MNLFFDKLIRGPKSAYRSNGFTVLLGSILSLALVGGCGPASEDVADGPGVDSADSVVVEEMNESEPDVSSADQTANDQPATVVDFSTWEGNDVTWEIAEGKSESLYAEQDFTNKTAPNLIVQQWLGEQPELDGEKFLLIDFWATWCPPCRASIPELNEIAEKFGNELAVVGLSDESVDQVREMTQPVIEYYSAVDTEARTKSEIGVEGIPHVMLIDPSGKVAWQGFPMGEADPLTAERIQEIIDLYHAR